MDRERGTNNIQIMANQNYCSVLLGYDAVLLGGWVVRDNSGNCSACTVRVGQSRIVY